METRLADKTSPLILQAWLSQRRCRVLAGPLKCSDNNKIAASLLLCQKINQGQVTGSQNCPSVHPRGQIFTSQILCRRQPSPHGQSRAHQGERQLSSSMRPSCCLQRLSEDTGFCISFWHWAHPWGPIPGPVDSCLHCQDPRATRPKGPECFQMSLSRCLWPQDLCPCRHQIRLWPSSRHIEQHPLPHPHLRGSIVKPHV